MDVKALILHSTSIWLPPLSALIIFFFFRLIQHYDTQLLMTMGSKAYLSVSEFAGSTISLSIVLRFVLFRIFPPFIVFIFETSILQRVGLEQYVMIDLVLTCLLFSALTDIPGIFKSFTFGERFIHICFVVLYLGMAISSGWLSSRVNISSLSPSFSGVVDNLWSTLIIALIIAIYIELFRETPKAQAENNLLLARKKTVAKHLTTITKYHCATIIESCQEYHVCRSLLLSILIYEDMNRPAIVRWLEQLCVRIPKVRLSVGLAQVQSDTPINDDDSIRIAAAKLSHTAEADRSEIIKKLKNYNNDESYLNNIGLINCIVVEMLGISH